MLVRPVAPQKPIEDAAQIPDLNLEVPAPPEPLAVTRTGPARPHLPAPAMNRGDTPPAKLDVPPIVPELSAQESNDLQRQTELSLGNAERNIAAASRKPLNATQSDLASKVRGFISDAHEAGRVGDWPRARDLAKKAQVLSEELANSL